VINIDVKIDSEKLILSVSDNGIGMEISKIQSINENLKNHVDSKVNNKKSGIGLLNVNKRIFLICGENFGLTVVPNKVHGITVICKLPIEKSINNSEELK
jgi:two-component system sensor histidine kinase YesM